MENYFEIDPEQELDFHKIKSIFEQNLNLRLSKNAVEKITNCRVFLDKKLKEPNQTFYGINTGFGSLCQTQISQNELTKLQENLIMSHACGQGKRIPNEIVKMMLLLKIQSLSYGNSGVQLTTVERLIFFFNENIFPVIYQQGSLGASGDLAPLAHLSLPLIGLGEVEYNAKIFDTADLYKALEIKPIELKAKEGIALLNGTQFMSAYGTFILMQIDDFFQINELIASLSLEIFHCKAEPFHHLLHQIRAHDGQVSSAKNIRNILSDSEIFHQKREYVQDPYSFRCIPQVHGAAKDNIEFVKKTFLTEINSVSDNPNIFPEEDLILSGGNFHGEPLAIALDLLAIALSNLGNISERRVYKLISGQRGLPEFLIKTPGINSGLMIAQYTAAGIVSENKTKCMPNSVDSVPSSNGQEDYVSMGANAAVKTYDIFENYITLLSIELLAAFQASQFRAEKFSSETQKIITNLSKTVEPITDDRILYRTINECKAFLKNYSQKL